MGEEVLDQRRTQIARPSKSGSSLSGRNVIPATGDRVLQYTAPNSVCDVVAKLGRTEDIKFSPSNRRLAVASFLRNKIAVFEVCIATSSSGNIITLTDVVEFSSTYLHQPHGVNFIDEEKIIVANRNGDATIFQLPHGGGSGNELVPLEIIRSGDVLHSPGSVAIIRKDQDLYEALICNNYTNKITRHIIDFSEKCYIRKNEVLLEKWLNIPDGVSISDGWIAISNHDGHSVLLYRNRDSLDEFSDPDGILCCAYYPHGLRFSPDGRFILVADAGTPYVHIYRKDHSGWGGVRRPFKSIRVLTDKDFLLGRHSISGSVANYVVEDGGPKGIDIDNSMSIMVTTCEAQPLAFFDLAGIFEISGLHISREKGYRGEIIDSTYDNDDQKALEVKYELDIRDDFKQQIDRMKKSRSWRITAPLRWVTSLRGR